MPDKILSITVASSFTASHWHDKTLNEGSHPHNFKYEVTLEGPLNEEGYLLDFRKVEEKLKQIDAKLEAAVLNDILRYPTTENLAVYIFREVQKDFPQITKVTVREKENYRATYQRP
jgi:6-pyruvoyl-tetrahydropterin synthase